MESVWIYAKADRHLLQVLEATGDYSKTARGAILIFLLMQITHSASPLSDKVGVFNPLTQYVQSLPPRIPLPTFWNDVERACIAGTSLDGALQSKLRSLDKEFTQLREATLLIDWCHHHWWSGKLTFKDWKHIDAMYRSRALDLPGVGHAMVPCIDMANHASGDDTVALYDTLPNGTAVLALREGKQLTLGDEVTITYGDEKGACEMLFSYGFLEDMMSSARELFLELDIPDDDPLKLAKKAVSQSAPGFRLFQNGDSVDWESDFIWLLCINEEDGLRFRLLQTLDGVKELSVSWKEKEITDAAAIKDILQQEPRWDVFRLRANTILQQRVGEQLLSLDNSSEYIRKASDLRIDSPIFENIMRLRDLESSLMVRAYEMFEERVLSIH
ncbi:MAG: hypothetical protein LQ351_007200 [Letrouitia transgressa]|nr:MAG: hypothetical protein LQ351_007200 [Letrouitia transgressa]